MSAVQKKYKPIWVDEPQQDCNNLVSTPSDEASGFFWLKNYKHFTSSYSKWKKEKKSSARLR